MHLILKIRISRDTECVNTIGFPNLCHNYIMQNFGVTIFFANLHKRNLADNIICDHILENLPFKHKHKF